MECEVFNTLKVGAKISEPRGREANQGDIGG